jgi:hypothetical protein
MLTLGNGVIHENKFYELSIKYKGFIFNLRDSYLLLPSSLRDLVKGYDIGLNKYYFPHDFVNRSTLNYKGETPDLKY